VFQEHGLPEEIEPFQLRPGQLLVEVIVDSGAAGSRSEARRLVDQKGVRLDDTVLDDPNLVLQVAAPAILRVGKRRFLRLLPPT
jgi:tyrosyl-tRNA synthetase